MPRRGDTTFEDIEKAEIAADQRKEGRKGGYSLMSERDQGWYRFTNGVIMFWNVPAPLENGQARVSVHPDQFVLEVNGKRTAFDAEEFRKRLRWV